MRSRDTSGLLARDQGQCRQQERDQDTRGNEPSSGRERSGPQARTCGNRCDDVSRTFTLPLSRGLVATVDEADYDAARRFKWYATVSGGGQVYAIRNTKRADGSRGRQYLHRFIAARAGFDLGLQVDHVDSDGLNNRRSNLRAATRSENQANRGPTKRNTSGLKGVRELAAGQWRAQIQVRGATRSLGVFPTPAEAARAYDRAAVEAFGAYARTNGVRP